MDKFQQRFIDEAKEYFENLELVLINLETDFSNTKLVEEVFRHMHSLKGSGAMFGFTLLSEATHELESLYDLIRSGSLKLNSSIIGFTLKSIDLLRKLISLEVEDHLIADVGLLKAEIAKVISGIDPGNSYIPQASSKIGTGETKTSQIDKKTFFVCFQPSKRIFENGTNPLYLIDELNTFGECSVRAYMDQIPPFDEINPEKCNTSWRVLLETDQEIIDIEDVFLFVKEDGRLDIVQIKDEKILNDKLSRLELFNGSFEEAIELAVTTRIDEKPIIEKSEKSKGAKDKLALSTIRVNSQKIDEYMNLVSEIITAQSRLMLFAETQKDQEILAISETFQKLIRQLRDNAFDMSLVPLYNMMARFKRLVRDLSADMHKEIELLTEGLDTEVDKNMIDKLADPLLHIIRNCIDHGIEQADVRLRKGKSAKGIIHVKASYVGTFVQIEILDDGAGLDFEKIRQRAVDKKMVQADSELTQPELMKLIFEPGFSTATEVSGVSGRGVGMDVVQKAIKDLRGEIEIDSKAGEGTNFTIRLPLTLSIIDGLLTKVADDYFVVPTSMIEKIYALEERGQVNNFRQVVVFDGKEIPYLNLRNEFNQNAEALNQQYMIAVNLGNNQMFGLVVDDVLREYQAVVKPLGKILRKHDIFLGASILGDGKIALVVDINKIIRKFSV